MMGFPGLVPAYLPELIRELIGLIGEEATGKIVEARGGITLCVPVDARPGHWLRGLIGDEAFERLVEEYRGIELYIPRCTKALQKLREAEIVADHEAGMGTVELARKYGYSDRGIRLMLQRAREASTHQQPDLFDEA